MDKGTLFPDVRIFDEVRIETHSLRHLLHGSSNFPMGTTRDNDSVEALFPNSLFDAIQILRKASQANFFNMGHLSQLLGPGNEVGDGQALLQLFTAMTEENPYFGNLVTQGS